MSPFGYDAIMVGVSQSHSDTLPIAYTQIPILENALMDSVSELVQAEIKAYVTKNISFKLKVFRESNNLKGFNAWMKTWPVAKDPEPSTSSPHGDRPLLAPKPLTPAQVCMATHKVKRFR